MKKRDFRRYEEIDWSSWQADDLACLLFVVKDGKVLLIHKKRGLGAGKINAPGGRFEDGELPIQCAVREVKEEVRVTPLEITHYGVLKFQFTDGYALQCHVFRADDCIGDPEETEEAKPFWTPVDKIPFDRMWQDDRLWLPLMLARQNFEGRFLFDGDQMLGHEIDRLV